MRTKPEFVGPRQPTLREQLAWAGITSRGDQTRERSLLWRRRQKQLLKERAALK